MQMAKVTILKEGYAYLDSSTGLYHANASCTLVQSPENTVIVDTLTPWDGPFIIEKLQELGVQPSQVNFVVSTHGHSDHNGNNNLFLNAKQHIMGYCISNKDQYYMHPFELDEPYVLDSFIKIIPTPGHTNEDVSLVVKLAEEDDSNNKNNILVIAGDLFESEKDILNPDLWTANSFQPEIQVKNRLKVLKMAQSVIPGHGPMFTVTDDHIKAAVELSKRYDDTKNQECLKSSTNK